ncbi:unnamed protein product [Leptidea sinapis]|uniref:PiggyBac transposable element-derived protein domain-containing protein n=1 Tax=Leptidea sinapis TaxID=189913 RepID=A0A5E4R4J2_9NEOP|nr:unnamed protein product [Leptidea sinapis]
MSIDEMMIPFAGQCGIRVYLRWKPNPLGLKVVVLANPNGVVCDMIVYQCDTTFPTELTERYSLGECLIMFLTRTLVPGHIIHCDRYFTTLKLADSMLEKGFYLVGTIMANRIPRHIALMSEYNLSMGGVDLADRMLSDCPSRARTKKWTVRVVFHMFDLAATNSWFVYRQECVRNRYVEPDFINIAARHRNNPNKRTRSDLSPETPDKLQLFEEKIVKMLSSWKKEQEIVLKSLSSDILEVKRQNQEIQKSNCEIE